MKMTRKPVGTPAPKNLSTPQPTHQSTEVTDNGITVLKDIPNNPEGLVIKQYLEFVGQHGITRDDIRDILNSILDTGGVTWEFELFGRIPVQLSLKKAWVDNDIIEIVDRITENDAKVSNIRFNNLVSEYNLAACLTKFRDKTYTVNSKADLEAAVARIRDLPFVIKSNLVNKLAAFDRAVALATSDWAVKNFTNPPKED